MKSNALLIGLLALVARAQHAPYPPFTAQQAELGKQLAAKSAEIRKQITDLAAPAEPFKVMGNLYFVGNSNGEVTLKDAVPDAFRKLKDLAGECNDVVDKAPEHLDQAPRIETLRETAIVLEDLRVPDVRAELASINIALLKPRRLRSRGDRRDAALDMIDACMKALNTIPQGDPRHQQACDLCAKLQDASTDAENCEFPGMYG